MMKKYNFFSYC